MLYNGDADSTDLMLIALVYTNPCFLENSGARAIKYDNSFGDRGTNNSAHTTPLLKLCLLTCHCPYQYLYHKNRNCCPRPLLLKSNPNIHGLKKKKNGNVQVILKIIFDRVSASGGCIMEGSR